ncbi:hypothetical protein EDD16DRAFT_1587241, partial [Pisolithus croceorrhizus]
MTSRIISSTHLQPAADYEAGTAISSDKHIVIDPGTHRMSPIPTGRPDIRSHSTTPRAIVAQSERTRVSNYLQLHLRQVHSDVVLTTSRSTPRPTSPPSYTNPTGRRTPDESQRDSTSGTEQESSGRPRWLFPLGPAPLPTSRGMSELLATETELAQTLPMEVRHRPSLSGYDVGSPLSSSHTFGSPTPTQSRNVASPAFVSSEQRAGETPDPGIFANGVGQPQRTWHDLDKSNSSSQEECDFEDITRRCYGSEVSYPDTRERANSLRRRRPSTSQSNYSVASPQPTQSVTPGTRSPAPDNNAKASALLESVVESKPPSELSPTTRRNRDLARALGFGTEEEDNGVPEPISTHEPNHPPHAPFASSSNPNLQRSISLRDPGQLTKMRQKFTEANSSMLSVTRKRISPSQISTPVLVSAPTSVETIPLPQPTTIPPSNTQSSLGITQRVRRLRNTLRVKPSSLVRPTLPKFGAAVRPSPRRPRLIARFRKPKASETHGDSHSSNHSRHHLPISPTASSHRGNSVVTPSTKSGASSAEATARASNLGLDKVALNDLLARSTSVSRATGWGLSAGSRGVGGVKSPIPAGPVANNVDQTRPATPDDKRMMTPTHVNAETVNSTPSDQGVETPAVVRRTLIFPSEFKTSKLDVGPSSRRQSMKRHRRTGSATSAQSARSVHDRAPTPPPPKANGARRLSADRSPPFPEALLRGPRRSCVHPVDESGRERGHDGTHQEGTAVEVVEMANGETVVYPSKVDVNGLREDDNRDDMQIFVREHTRSASKGSSSSFVSLKKAYQGKNRPETK